MGRYRSNIVPPQRSRDPAHLNRAFAGSSHLTDRWPKHWPPETAARVVVLAELKRGAHDRAAELLAAGPPFDPGQLGFERHGVYLSSEEVVFVFEGASAARRLADLIDDMVSSPSFGAWAPLLEGAPRIAYEHYFWQG